VDADGVCESEVAELASLERVARAIELRIERAALGIDSDD